MHPVLKWAVFGMILCLMTVQVIEHNLPAFMAATSDQEPSKVAQGDRLSSSAGAEQRKTPDARAQTKIDRRSDRHVQKMRVESPQKSTNNLPPMSIPEVPSNNFPEIVADDMPPPNGFGPDDLAASDPIIHAFPPGDE
ncbi:MAG: hypothetical protein V3V30_03535 [Parvularculaceae bacterium]